MKKKFRIFLFIAMLLSIAFVTNKKSINASTDLSVGVNVRNLTINITPSFTFPDDGGGQHYIIKFEGNNVDYILGIGKDGKLFEGSFEGFGIFSEVSNNTSSTITIPNDKDYIISELNYVVGTYEEPVGCPHDWIDATCTTAKTCSICGQTEGEPLGHTWVEATKYAPKTCSTCGQKEGNLLPFNDNRINVYCFIGSSVETNEFELIGIPFYFNCYEINNFPDDPVNSLIELSNSGKIMTAYYLTTDKKIYVYDQQSSEWLCWTDNPTMLESMGVYYCGYVSSQAEIQRTNDDTDNMYIYFEVAEETTKSIYFAHDQNNDADMGSLEYSTTEYTYLSEINDLWTIRDTGHYNEFVTSWDVYKTSDLENKLATITSSDGTILANDNYVLVPASWQPKVVSYVVNGEVVKEINLSEWTSIEQTLSLSSNERIIGYYSDPSYEYELNDYESAKASFINSLTLCRIYVKVETIKYQVIYICTFNNSQIPIKSDIVETSNYQITSLDDYDVPGVAFDRKWSTIFTYNQSNYTVGDTITLSTDNLDNFYVNEIYVSIDTYFKGIKYYYNNELVHTQNATSWDIEYWNLETIDKTDLCSFEKLILIPKLKEINISKLTTLDELRLGYESYYRDILKQDCDSDYFAEVVVTTEHDDFYYGPTIIYKNISSYLLPEDIENLISQNIVNCKHSIIYEFEDVDYIGNASTSGSYQYKLKMNDKEYIIQIVVTKNINSSYIFGKDLYFPVNSKLSTNQIVSDLKKVGLIENTNLSTRFIAKNESSSKYLTDETAGPGVYNYTINYQSTNGINGEIDINLNVLNAMDFTTDDPIDTSSCKKLNLKTEDIIAYCLVGLFVVGIFTLLFSNKKKRTRR